MKVSDLIDALMALPQWLDVGILYDGGVRATVVHAWVARGYKEGPYVVLGGHDEPVYDDCDRPVYAPTQAEDPYWRTGGEGSGLPALIYQACCDLIALTSEPPVWDEEEGYANSSHCKEVEEKSYIVRRLSDEQRARAAAQFVLLESLGDSLLIRGGQAGGGMRFDAH